MWKVDDNNDYDDNDDNGDGQQINFDQKRFGSGELRTGEWGWKMTITLKMQIINNLDQNTFNKIII